MLRIEKTDTALVLISDRGREYTVHELVAPAICPVAASSDILVATHFDGNRSQVVSMMFGANPYAGEPESVYFARLIGWFGPAIEKYESSHGRLNALEEKLGGSRK